MLLEKLSYADNFPIRITVASVTEDPIHYHSDIEFVYVLRGEVALKNGYCQYQLRAGDIFTNAGNEVHSLKGMTEDNVVACIHVSTTDLSQYFPNLSKACYRTYSKQADDKRYSRLKELMLQLLMKYLLRGFNYRSECLYLMVDVIKHLNKYFNLFAFDKDMVVGFEQGNQLASDRISRICQYIYQNYAENITLQDLSDMEYLSPFYLSHLIKDFTGMNFREFLCFARVEMSEVRLLGTDMKISQIARDVGFSTTAYYDKYFTRWFGLSPAEHRARYRPQVKSDLKPAVYAELSSGDAIAVVQEALSRYHARREVDSVISSLHLDVDVRTGSKAVQRFDHPLSVTLTCEDYRVLGAGLFEALMGLGPSKVVLIHDGEDEVTYQKFRTLLLDSGLNVEVRDAIPRDVRCSYAFDSIAYAIFLLSKNGENERTPLEVLLRDAGTGGECILQGQPAAITAGGVKKPGYYAYMLLSKIKGEVIMQGNQYCVIRCRNADTPYFVVLTYNYNEAIRNICLRDTAMAEVKNIINDFRDELNLSVSLDLKPGSYSIIKYSMTKENNIFAHLSALDFQDNALAGSVMPQIFSCAPVLETYIEEVRTACHMNFLLKGIGIQAAVICPRE